MLSGMLSIMARLNSLHVDRLHDDLHATGTARMTARPPTGSRARLLAFDTSTEQLAIGVSSPSGSAVYLGPGGAQASAALLPQIHALCQRVGLELTALDAIAFGRGPGAFTGLRTSCAVAQGLALGLGCPVLPIDSLLIVAEDARAQAGVQSDGVFEVGVAMDARMGEVYAARWQWQGGQWQALSPAALCTPESLVEAWQAHPPAWLAGTAWAALGPRLTLPAGPHQYLLQEQHRPAALLRLAEMAFAQGPGLDAALALPLYLRDKVALTTLERDAVRAAAANTAALTAATVAAVTSA